MAINAIREISPELFSAYQHNVYIDKQGALIRIMALPPVHPEQKKGKWVEYDDDKTICKCSECGATIGINEKYRNFFCYHCGADMKEEEWNE